MRVILSAVILGCCTISFAGDSLPDSYKNGLGWDNGLSYRHSIGKNTWLGLAVNGSITSSGSHSIDSGVEKDTLNDSVTYSYLYKSAGNPMNYSIKISTILIGEMAEYRIFGLDYFIQPAYSYSWGKIYNGLIQTNLIEKYDNRSQTLGVAAGFAPTITLFKRLCFETKFGINYAYAWSRNSTNYISKGSSAYNEMVKSDSYSRGITILGSPFSISMQLSGHFYF